VQEALGGGSGHGPAVGQEVAQAEEALFRGLIVAADEDRQ